MRTLFSERTRRIVCGAAAAILGAAACTPAAQSPAADSSAIAAPALSAEDAIVFPAGRTLMRPEDGVALADGTLLVADQRHGLVAVSPDGAVRPFGSFAAAGYVHAPPEQTAGPNGVAFEPDGRHVLTADIYTGANWRTDTASETTTLAYQHSYGVNTAVADSSGAIWFTQSTENSGPASHERLFAAVDRAMPDGALYRIAPGSGEAELKASGLIFANGIVIDEARGALYMVETMADRIVAFGLSVAGGALGEPTTLATVLTPDNIEMDAAGTLWVASPMGNEIVLVDPASGETRSFFRARTDASEAAAAEWRRRAQAGEARLELMAPPIWTPLPGLITGVILPPEGGETVYLSGLGDALVKLDAPE
jgi:sugar lactone lactonase YvrE